MAAAMASVQISEEVYRVCTAHSLMTEREEIMGLLLGDTSGPSSPSKPGAKAADPTVVSIWSCMTLSRSDKRPDRCEISPEQLVQASEAAERMSEAIGRRTRIVGWYHSHPHITILPSHVDLRTQMQYQQMDPAFVGLIFGAFNENKKLGTISNEVMGFRAQDAPAGEPLQRLCLEVSVVPVNQLLPEDACLNTAVKRKEGGWLGGDGLVAISDQCHAEMMERHSSTLDALTDPSGAHGSLSMARAEAWTIQRQRLSGLIQKEIAPLRQHIEDEAYNNKALNELYEERLCRVRKELADLRPARMVALDQADVEGDACSTESEDEDSTEKERVINSATSSILDVETMCHEKAPVSKGGAATNTTSDRIASTPTPPRLAPPHVADSNLGVEHASSSSSSSARQVSLDDFSNRRKAAQSGLPALGSCGVKGNEEGAAQARMLKSATDAAASSSVASRGSAAEPAFKEENSTQVDGFGVIFHVKSGEEAYIARPYSNDERMRAGNGRHPDTSPEQDQAKDVRFTIKNHGDEAKELAQCYLFGMSIQDLIPQASSAPVSGGKRPRPEDDIVLNSAKARAVKCQ